MMCDVNAPEFDNPSSDVEDEEASTDVDAGKVTDGSAP